MLSLSFVTPAQIARLRDDATARVERLRAELAVAIKEEALFTELLALQHRDSVLQNQHSDARIIDTMETNTAVRGARLGTKHVGATRIREVDGSVARFAAKHGLFATTVRSWYATGEAAREIPRKWADLLAKKPYLVPLASWKNGISD
jgi:hypothetical protein